MFNGFLQEGFRGHIIVFYDESETEFVGILAFDVGEFWWYPEPFLLEQLVLCVNPDYIGFEREAVKVLDEIAEEYNCVGICSGCMFQSNPNMVKNTYMKSGYNEMIPSFVKLRKRGKSEG